MKQITKITLLLVVMLTLSYQLFALNIAGKVLNDKGLGIPNVKVIVKESGKSVFSDAKGSFLIKAEANQNLIFRHQDYAEITIAINGRSNLQVTLTAITFSVKDIEVFFEEDKINVSDLGSNELVAQSFSPQIRSKNRIIKKEGFTKAAYPVGKPYQGENTESYAGIQENGYKNVFDYPLSTFSVDVDNASYANVRRYLNMGQLPPADAVRVEEMINYFEYDYAKPNGKDPYAIHSDLAICPWNKSHQLLLVGLKAKEIDKSSLPPSNLVFLIDVSGSMQDENKLPLVKSALRMLVSELRPGDRVAMVVYAGAAGLVLEPTPGTQKQKILDAIDGLEAGGSTAGGEGLLLAYKTAHKNFIKEGNNRIILATDGDFNVGVSSNSEMEKLVENERKSGVFITVLGFGMGNYKDDKLETIANKGNGNYGYIDNIQEARRIFIKEFGGTLFTVAKDVKFQLEFNPEHVKAYRLIGYENRLLNDEDFKDDTKDAGEMGMGHRVTALYEIIPAGSDEQVSNIDELKYQQRRKDINKSYSSEMVTIKTRYKLPDGNTSYPLNKIVNYKAAEFDKASENLRFAAAVAGFGMLIRNSDYKGSIGYSDIATIAQKAKGNDEEGYRGEMIRMIKVAQNLDQSYSKK
jgi:Ca-activated chloride channel family protein